MKINLTPLFIITLLIGCVPIWLSAQVAINTTGAAPDSSALLDIQSTVKGLLTPQMTKAQREAITDPATGLLVYQTDELVGFYYNEGTVLYPQLGKNGYGGGAGRSQDSH